MVAHPRGTGEGAGQALDGTWELGHTGPRGGGAWTGKGWRAGTRGRRGCASGHISACDLPINSWEKGSLDTQPRGRKTGTGNNAASEVWSVNGPGRAGREGAAFHVANTFDVQSSVSVHQLTVYPASTPSRSRQGLVSSHRGELGHSSSGRFYRGHGESRSCGADPRSQGRRATKYRLELWCLAFKRLMQ